MSISFLTLEIVTSGTASDELVEIATVSSCLELQLDQNSLASEMRTRGNERVSVRQGYGYGCSYGTLNEANLLKTDRTCCSLEA
jgi:hypothetical protein